MSVDKGNDQSPHTQKEYREEKIELFPQPNPAKVE